jgi:hypothetical protein
MGRTGLLQRRTPRRAACALSLAVALWLVFAQGHSWSAQRWGSPGTYDFVAYWSSARLLLQRQNPYDAHALLQMEQALGWPWPDPARIWNPPWALALMLPFALVPFGFAHMAWLLLQLALIIGSSVLLWRHFLPQNTLHWIAPVLAIGFFPAQASLITGQLGAWALVGVAVFLYAARSRRDLLAGSALSLLLIKPHVSYLFWSAALWWALRERRWKALVGWAAALAVASGIAALLDPEVFVDFMASVMKPPLDWPAPPTLGTLLRLLFGWEQYWLPFLPSLLGALGLVIWLWRQRGVWKWERAAIPLLLASVMAAPYGWSYDQLVLLPVVIALFSRIMPIHDVRGAAIAAMWAASQLGCAILTQYRVDFYLVWHAPVLAGLYIWVRSLYTGRTRTKEAMNDA